MEKTERAQYRDKFKLMNKSEHVLYSRLVEATPALLVFCQVSMSQLFHINSTHKKGFLQVAEIGRKSVDFLLCREDTSILLAIELNGPTHEREAQKVRDEKKRIALEEAGIPLIVFDPNGIPDVQELRKTLAPFIVERRKNEAERDLRVQASRSKAEPVSTKIETPAPSKKKFWFRKKAKT